MKRLLSLMLFLFLGCIGMGILAISPGTMVNAAGVQTATKSTKATEPIAEGTFGTCRYVVDQDGGMTIAPEEGQSGTLGNSSKNPWNDFNQGHWTFPDWVSKVTSIHIAPGVAGNYDSSRLFYGFSNVKSIDLSNFNATSVTYMGSMFEDCSKLLEIKLPSTFQNDRIADTSALFKNCESLKSLDLSSLDTNRVTDMNEMFEGCTNLTELNLAHFNTENVINMIGMFYNCKNLQEINLDNFNTKKVISFTMMFAGCEKLQALNLSTFDTKTAFQQGIDPDSGMFDNMSNLWRLDLGENTQITLNSNLPSPVAGEALPDNSGYIAKSDEWQAVADGTDHEPTGSTYSSIDLAFLTQNEDFTGGRFVWEQTFPVEPEPEPEPKPNPDPNPEPNPTPSPSQPETSTPEPAPSPQPTPTPNNPETPTTPTKPNEATTKQTVVYAVKGLYLYRTPMFTKTQRLVRYPKQKRINRPLFIVTGYARSTNGALRYKVRTTGPNQKAGYITANSAYVKPVYYQTLPKNGRVTIIATKGVNAYRTTNLTGKVAHYKRGRHLRVKKLVKHNLTTRYQLSNGSYVTANKKLVIQGVH